MSRFFHVVLNAAFRLTTDIKPGALLFVFRFSLWQNSKTLCPYFIIFGGDRARSNSSIYLDCASNPLTMQFTQTISQSSNRTNGYWKTGDIILKILR